MFDFDKAHKKWTCDIQFTYTPPDGSGKKYTYEYDGQLGDFRDETGRHVFRILNIDGFNQTFIGVEKENIEAVLNFYKTLKE